MQNEPDQAETQRLAYQLWLERGCPIGSPGQDWFRAEEELRGRTADHIAGRRVCMSQRIAVVTGASRGSGEKHGACACRKGVSSIFTFVSKSAEADEVISAVTKTGTKTGTKTVAFQLDTGKVGGFDNFVGRVSSTVKEWGSDRIDYLVNNAGICACPER
jgi:hypothetical protein